MKNYAVTKTDAELKEDFERPFQSVSKAIFLPSVFPKTPFASQPILSANRPRTTLVGQHIYVRQEFDSTVSAGGDRLVKCWQPGDGGWRLQDSHTLDHGNLPNIFYTTKADMSILHRMQENHATQCCPFSQLPAEVRIRIFQFLASRNYTCQADKLRFNLRSNFYLNNSLDASIMLNVQLSCRFLYHDITTFIFEQNEFYFSCSESIDHLLTCFRAGPLNPGGHHLGVVILDIKPETNFPTKALIHPALPLQSAKAKDVCVNGQEQGVNGQCGGGNNNTYNVARNSGHATKTLGWDGHLALLLRQYFPSYGNGAGHFVLKRKSAWKLAADSSGQIDHWARAVKELLPTVTIGTLVIRGNEGYLSALFSTSVLVKTLCEFKGEGRIGKVYKAGSWPAKGSEKLLRMFQNTLQEDAVKKVKAEQARNRALQARRLGAGAGQKRKRTNKDMSA